MAASAPLGNHSNTLVTPDLVLMTEVTLSVLLTLQLSLVCVVHDDSMAQEVGTLSTELPQHEISLITYSADDVIISDAALASFLRTIKANGDRTVAMVLSADFSKIRTVFTRVSQFRNTFGRQSGIQHFTKWLTLVPVCCNVTALEQDVSEFTNVAAILSTTHGKDKKEVILVHSLIIKPEGPRFQPVGSLEDGELRLDESVFPNVHRGFNGRHLRIGLYVWYPFTMRVQRGNETTYEGFCVDLVLELSKRLNFTFSLTEPADNNWGSLLPDGSWTGVVGMLQKFEIDVSVAALIITSERAQVMDATFPFYYDNVGVLYKRPSPKSNFWKIYFQPFKAEVFQCLAGSLLGGAIIFVFVGVASPRNKRKRQAKEGGLANFVVSEAKQQTGHLAAIYVQHGHLDLPMYGSGRVFLAFWWIFTIMLAAIYKGNLTAFLLVPVDDIPFTSLMDLGSQDQYKWGVTGSTVVEYLFQVSERADFKKLGEGIEHFKASDPDINSLDPLVHLEKVKKGRYAYISDMVPMEIWKAQDCDLRTLKETVIPLPFVVGLHNNSAYLKAFNDVLLSIDQMGLTSVWKDHWWPRDGNCAKEGDHAMKIISVMEAQAAFYILCAGFLLSSLTLGVEYVWKRSMACRFYLKSKMSGPFLSGTWRLQGQVREG